MTRRTTGVTGFSIGRTSIGVNWRSEGHDWTNISQPGDVATVC